MSYKSARKRVKIIPWLADFKKTEELVNQECDVIEKQMGQILSIKIFDEDTGSSPACAIVYEL